MTENKETEATQKVETERVQEGPGTYYTPPVDIYEMDETIIVEADMPGVDRTDLEVKIDNGLLTMQGRVKCKSLKDVTQLYDEFVPGDFYRAFTLGEQIDEGRISAVITDGVLTVTLPKAQSTRARRIEIK